MARQKKAGQGSGETAEALGESLAEALIAAHGGDAQAAWAAMNGPGGVLEQMLAGPPDHAGGAAFGLVGNSPTGLAAFGRHMPERRYTLPDPPGQASTLRVRIDIDDARPPIWRRLDLAGDLMLDEVHTLIQIAFGWGDYHLHSFTPQIDGQKDRRVRPFPNEGTIDVCDDSLPDESDVRLDQLVRAAGDRLFYEYDFGDGWQHTLAVEHVLPRHDGDPLATCVGGRRAGPPEDVGGIWRYNDLVVALKEGPTEEIDAEDLAEFREWIGGEFDPGDAGLDGLDLDGFLRGVRRAHDHIVTLPGNPRLAPLCAAAVDRAAAGGALPAITAMVLDAGLDLEAEPPSAARAAVVAGLTTDEAAAAVRPWQILLDTIGPDGAELTAAGYLRPAVVEALFTALDMGEEWIGKGNREDLTPPVADVRQAATHLGLVRKYRGRLRPTKAARAVSGDPVSLWHLVVGAVARPRQDFKDDATAIALLLLAADAQASEPRHERPPHTVPPTSTLAAFDDLAPTVLGALGWRLEDDVPTPYAARWWARTVWEVVGRSSALMDHGRVTEAGRRLARAALLTE